jgi:nitrile hydratase
MGFGSVAKEKDEPAFHEEWESRVRGLKQAIGRAAGADPHQQRHAIERMDPGHYLTASYYERWLTGAATVAVENGLVSQENLEARAGGAFPLARSANFSPSVVTPGESCPTGPRFAVGDWVRVRDVRPLGHTRCPWYVRGRVGIITRYDGTFPLPDLAAHRLPEMNDHSYNVGFAASHLFDEAEPNVTILIDLFERYLEASP